MQISRAKSYRNSFLLAIFIAFIFGVFCPARAQQNCLEIFTIPPSQLTEIKTLDDLGRAMTNGMILSPSQGDIFELYRVIYFGDYSTFLGTNTFKTLTQALAQNPGLQKSHFREYEIRQDIQMPETTQGLNKFIAGQTRSAAQTRSNLFHIMANTGYWKTLLGLRGTTETEFKQALSRIVRTEIVEQLAKPASDIEENTTLLFQSLRNLRQQLTEQGKDSRALAQAMTDLVHAASFESPELNIQLKSSDSLEKIEAFEKVLAERDNLSRLLGFADFRHLLKTLEVDAPTGTSKNIDYQALITDFRNQVLLAKNALPEATTTFRMRSLSLQESPFRSCLGRDCASREYFDKALDPNFYYFTLTTADFKSDGQITIVVGNVTDGSGKKTQAAFVDKIQHVPTRLISSFLEAIRLTVLEKGYTLVLPRSTIQTNGISDTSEILNYFLLNLGNRTGPSLGTFTPESHDYYFQNMFSRSEESPVVRALLPLDHVRQNATITPGQSITVDWQAPATLSASTLINDLISLKDSPRDEDKLRFIGLRSVLTSLYSHGVDPYIFVRTMNLYIRDKRLSFAVRKRALLTMLEGVETQRFLLLLQSEKVFSSSEWKQIGSEIKQWGMTANTEHKAAHAQIVNYFLHYPQQLIPEFYQLMSWNAAFATAISVEGLKLAANQGADVNSKTFGTGALTALHGAVRDGDLERVQFLLSLPNFNPNIISGPRDNGVTALSMALQISPMREDIAEALLASPRVDPNINYYNWGDYHPLILDLIRHRDLEALTLLLERKDVEIKMEHLDIAYKDAFTEGLKLLIHDPRLKVETPEDQLLIEKFTAAIASAENLK